MNSLLPVQSINQSAIHAEVTKRKLKGDFTFLDLNNVVVAQLTGYEAAMDDSLFKAFKTKDAANA